MLLTATLLLAGGCPSGSAPEPDPPSGDAVSFTRQVWPIFADNCGSCHQPGGVGELAGLRMQLTPSTAYDDLIDQPSAQNAALTLVVPGDAEASLLYQKVASDRPPVGQRMPLFSGPLSSAELAAIRDWIDQGALHN